MSSAIVQRLAERVRQAASLIHDLRKERERLQAELTLMEEESRRARKVIREHAELVAERQRVQDRLEKALQTLDRLKV